MSKQDKPQQEYLSIRITRRLHAHLEASSQIAEFKDAEHPQTYWNVSPTARRELLHLDPDVPYYNQVSEKRGML